MKRIAVLGPIPRDHIVTHQGEVIKKYGCVTHPVIALAKLAQGSIEIVPVAHVRKIDQANIEKVFEGYPGINLKHISSDRDHGAVISLRFVDQNNRLERQTGYMDPILPEDVKDLLDCDAFVFIPISDYEISLDTLKYLRKSSKGIIIFDAHGPTTACLANGERQRRFWLERDQWLPYIDVLKMNIEEANCSMLKVEYEDTDFEIQENVDREALREFAKHCLSLGTRCVYITIDSRGCLAYYNNENGFQEELVPSVKVEHVIDTTGCGDSFAGGVGFGLLHSSRDYSGAARFGNALGALRTQGKTFEVFKTLEQTKKIIAQGHL
jgi:sugar/nucleoside kinase (ribokinase family)